MIKMNDRSDSQQVKHFELILILRSVPVSNYPKTLFDLCILCSKRPWQPLAAPWQIIPGSFSQCCCGPYPYEFPSAFEWLRCSLLCDFEVNNGLSINGGTPPKNKRHRKPSISGDHHGSTPESLATNSLWNGPPSVVGKFGLLSQGPRGEEQIF